MVRLLLFILLLSPVAVGIPRIAHAAQNDEFIVNENQGIVIARFKTQAPKQDGKLPADVLELMRFFGITMSQESLIESKDGRLLYKTSQKNAFGEKSEFHEMRWQDGDYFIVATVLNESAEALGALKKLPQNPWAQRKTANSETEAGICPTCESSKLFKPIDEWAKSAREWVAVDCQADKVDGKVTAGKIISSIGSCLRGVAVSVVDIAKLIYDIASTQLKVYHDPKYAIAFTKVIWEAVRHPQAFLQNLFTMVLQAAKDQWGKLKSCSVDYQVGFTCQLLVDFLIPGGAIVKGVKVGMGVGKTAAAVIRGAISAEAKVAASAVKTTAKVAEAAGGTALKATDDVALTARTVADDVEYVASSGGKDVAKATGDQVSRHLDDTELPEVSVLAKEAEEIQKIADEIAPGFNQLQINGKRRADIERLYKKLLDEKPNELNSASVAANAKILDELAKLIVEELSAQGLKVKAVGTQGWKAVGNVADLQKSIARSEEVIQHAARQMESAAPGSITHRNFHVQKLAEQKKLADYKARLHEAEMSRMTDSVEIDLDSTPELRRLREVFDRRLDPKNPKKFERVSRISIPLREFQNGGAYSGMFRTADRSIELGINSVLNPEGVIDAVARHEFHHASSMAKKQRGVNYPFFAEVFAGGGHTINTLAAYSKYFDFDEVPAYSRSVAYAERGLENPTKIGMHEGMTKASMSRRTSTAVVRERAEQLKHMSHSALDAIKMARETISARGFDAFSLKVADGYREVSIPLYRKLAQVGKLVVAPPALRKGIQNTIVQEVTNYLDEMEAATRAHLASADRTLAMSEQDLAKRVQELTERSKNARARGGSGTVDSSRSGSRRSSSGESEKP